MGKAAKKRQVIVTWYKPKKRLPPLDCCVVVSFSGHVPGHGYENALGIGEYYPDEGWLIDGLTDEESSCMTVHAWCDIEPYGGADK